MNAARPPTFRPRTACNPLWAVVLKRSPRLGVAGSIPALESADRRCRAVLDRTRRVGHRTRQRPEAAHARYQRRPTSSVDRTEAHPDTAVTLAADHPPACAGELHALEARATF